MYTPPDSPHLRAPLLPDHPSPHSFPSPPTPPPCGMSRRTSQRTGRDRATRRLGGGRVGALAVGGDAGGQGEPPCRGEVFLDEDDAIQEIPIHEEDLPEADDEIGLDSDDEEPDDSIHIFTGHTDEVYTVACSPSDSSMVVTRGADDKGFCWKIGRANWNFELQGKHARVLPLPPSSGSLLLHRRRPPPPPPASSPAGLLLLLLFFFVFFFLFSFFFF
ncbi:hypothetical protein Taro_039998 [Colocasia esculenta]|uniref:Uncharacterized protein n=1 Tax=Colocasia esculenta TaxID=4460 RepID=A0A843WNX3_COLES|nr:hypothetical protein [Colocasia esculenta]